MEALTLTNNVSSLRFVEVNGRQFAIAPITILRSRVLEGSRGAIFYPAEENKKYEQQWNGRPLVATTHPRDKNGTNISANTPEILKKQEIGRFYNSTVNQQGTNTGEGWFDVELTKKHDSRIWNALVNHQKIEVSTGLYNEVDEAPKDSSYDGVNYNYIAKDYKPDHIAILVGEKGACSITDGCGVNNSATVNTSQIPEEELSANSLNQFMTDWMTYNSSIPQTERDKLPEDDFAGPHQSFPIRSQQDVADAARLIGHADNPEAVKEKIITIAKRKGFKIPDAWIKQPINNSSNSMNEKANMISWLTGNCACLKGKELQLNALTDNALKETILENAEKAVENDADASFMNWISNADKDIKGAITGMLKNKFKGAMGAGKPNDPAAQQPAAGAGANPPAVDPAAAAAEELKKKQAMMQPTGNAQTQPVIPAMTQEQFFAAFPFLKPLVANHQANENVEKAQLIGRITGHITDNTSKQQLVTTLNSKSVEDLRLIASLSVPSSQQQTNNNQNGHIPYAQPIANFFGATGITDNQDNSYLQKEQLVTNSINWQEWSKDNV